MHVVDVFSSVILHYVLFIFYIVVLISNDYKCSLGLSSRMLIASLLKKTFQPGFILDIMLFKPHSSRAICCHLGGRLGLCPSLLKEREKSWEDEGFALGHLMN